MARDSFHPQRPAGPPAGGRNNDPGPPRVWLILKSAELCSCLETQASERKPFAPTRPWLSRRRWFTFEDWNRIGSAAR